MQTEMAGMLQQWYKSELYMTYPINNSAKNNLCTKHARFSEFHQTQDTDCSIRILIISLIKSVYDTYGAR